MSTLLAGHPAGARSRTRLGKLPLQLVAKRGIVDTDADEISTRRSCSGGVISGHSGAVAQERGMLGGRSPLLLHRGPSHPSLSAALETSSASGVGGGLASDNGLAGGYATWRADRVLSGAERWAELRGAVGHVGSGHERRCW